MLSKHFSLEEMTHSPTAARKGLKNAPNAVQTENLRALCENILEPIRKYLNQPLFISSGFRSEELNAAIGGASKNGKATSQHCKGEAADIVCNGRNAEIFRYAKNLDFDQLIWEFGNNDQPEWVHISYKRNGANRKQILKAVKENGRTKYLRLQ